VKREKRKDKRETDIAFLIFDTELNIMIILKPPGCVSSQVVFTKLQVCEKE